MKIEGIQAIFCVPFHLRCQNLSSEEAFCSRLQFLDLKNSKHRRMSHFFTFKIFAATNKFQKIKAVPIFSLAC